MGTPTSLTKTLLGYVHLYYQAISTAFTEEFFNILFAYTNYTQ